MADLAAARASKAAAAEQVLRDREALRTEQQRRELQHLQAHRQGLKAVKPTLDRAALQDLGQAFAARLQVGWPHCHDAEQQLAEAMASRTA